MKIERDHVEWLAGVRAGETLGSPVAMLIPNRDWGNWEDVMAHEAAAPGDIRRRRVTRPRPGHADLAGVLKYDRRRRARHSRAGQRPGDRRASRGRRTRPPTARRVRRRDREPCRLARRRHRRRRPPSCPCRSTKPPTARRSGCSTPPSRRRSSSRIDAAKQAGDTLGGEVEVVARGPGRRARQPRALGPEARRPAGRDADVHPGGQGGRDRAGRRGGAPARLRGARSDRSLARRPRRRPGERPRGGSGAARNNAGGLEGGITTGEPLVLRVAMKPISTLMSPLPTVDLASGRPANAQSERSDVTAVPRWV